jgi:hypothetical protein
VGLISWQRKRAEHRLQHNADQAFAPGGGLATAALRVVGVEPSAPSMDARYESCLLTGVLQFDALPAVEVQGLYVVAPSLKWPRAGDELPAIVNLPALAQARTGSVKILWHLLPPRHELDATEAAAIAADLRGEPPIPRTGERFYRVPVIGADPTKPLPGSSGGGTTIAQANVLISTGEPAIGLVTSAVDVQPPRILRATAPPGGAVDLTLRVTRATGEPYDVTTRIGFSSNERRTLVAQVGATLPVRIDPARPDRVAIDTIELGFA